MDDCLVYARYNAGEMTVIPTAIEAAMVRADEVVAAGEAQRSAEWPKFITLTGAQFDAINTREWGIPTGTTIGRQWKAPCKDGSWNLATFTRKLPVPVCCRYHRYIVGVKDDRPCQAVRTAEGYVYDPQNPAEWERRTREHANERVEIKWSKIVCPERGVPVTSPLAVAIIRHPYLEPEGIIQKCEEVLL